MIESLIRQLSAKPVSSAPIIVALSGGADSVALLSILVSAGYKCIAAHCNFHLRGDESNRDEKHSIAIAKKLGAKIEVKHFDVVQYRESACRSTSIEMACRELRYAWFEQLRIKYNAAYIAVGHHSDDNVETMIFNLCRGTGIAGAKAMTVFTENHVWRPMLSLDRAQILEYLSSNNLTFVDDHTNFENDFSRNKIRNILLPTLFNILPTAKEGLALTVKLLGENYILYTELIKEKINKYVDEYGNVNVQQLSNEQPYATLLLYEYLKPQGINIEVAENVISSAEFSGKLFKIGSSLYVTSNGWLRKWNQCQNQSADISSYFNMEILDIDDFEASDTPSVACFDISVLEGPELSVRFWQSGDRISPYGMKGSKKISDLFTDAHIPRDVKQRIPLLVKDDNILWVAGIRASRLFKVTSKSKQFVKISLKSY